MVSDLVAARTAGGEGLDDKTVLGLLMLFLGGGQETTGKALTSALRLLGEHPELQRDLRAAPDRLPDFIEEVLRFEPPVRGIFRIATRDTHIGEIEVPEGSLIQLMWASGNRDEPAFEDAGALRPRGASPASTVLRVRSSPSATASTCAPERRSPGCRSASPSRSCSGASRPSAWLRTTRTTTCAATSCASLGSTWAYVRPGLFTSARRGTRLTVWPADRAPTLAR